MKPRARYLIYGFWWVGFHGDPRYGIGRTLKAAYDGWLKANNMYFAPILIKGVSAIIIIDDGVV